MNKPVIKKLSDTLLTTDEDVSKGMAKTRLGWVKDALIKARNAYMYDVVKAKKLTAALDIIEEVLADEQVAA